MLEKLVELLSLMEPVDPASLLQASSSLLAISETARDLPICAQRGAIQVVKALAQSFTSMANEMSREDIFVASKQFSKIALWLLDVRQYFHFIRFFRG